jgi:pseudouridine synthase
MPERLQKLLARAGFGSRRACEQLITAGRVSVNGKTVVDLGVKADPDRDQIAFDGRPISLPTHLAYVALNKPVGVVTTASDERGRTTVLDLIKSESRLFPVGRLDRDSEGLLLLTNDGEVAARLTHPRYGLEKEYSVRIARDATGEEIRRLREGIEIDGRLTAPARVDVAAPPRPAGAKPGEHWLRIVLHEGRKRQVRRMLASLGIPTLRLVRTRIGPLQLGSLKPGESRPLTVREIEALRRATGRPGKAEGTQQADRPPQPAGIRRRKATRDDDRKTHGRRRAAT